MLHSKSPSRGPGIAGRILLPLIAALALAAIWRYDTEIFRALYVGADRRPVVESRSWYQFLKTIGWMPTWLAIGAALIVAGAQNRTVRSGALLIAASGAAGVISELLKWIVGRYRPIASDGVHKYRVLDTDPTGPMGFTSSHAAVAFGAAFMLLFIYPRAGVLAILLALGCAWTRLLSGAHFASDAYMGLLLGYACARLLRPRHARTAGATIA